MPYVPTNTQGKNRATLRVAAYILLSQETSYEAGIAHFNQIIQTTQNYTSAGIYSDYTSMLSASRVNYERLLRDCREGRIDRILCRSVSDFAADEAGFLEVLNFLESCHVTVFFEEENMDTSNSSAMLTLSGLALFHREEKRGISESFHQIRKKQRAGGVTANRAIYGYRYAEGENAYDTTDDGYVRRRVVIVEKEAEVVRRIFRMVAEGKSYNEVARILNEEGVPAPRRQKSGGKAGSISNRGKPGKARNKVRTEAANSGDKSENAGTGIILGKTSSEVRTEAENSGVKTGTGSVGWTAQRISQMVRLERYMGDALLQKSYIIPGEAGKRVMNRGELPQEYVEGNHPAIVSRELFEAAQRPRKTDNLLKKEETGLELEEKILRDTDHEKEKRTGLLCRKTTAKQRSISPPALSGKIICGECGRNYHITNRKTGAIWVCPSTRLHNGLDICSAEPVREEKLLNMLKTALRVRFGGDGNETESEDNSGNGSGSGNGKGSCNDSGFGDNREIVQNLITLLERYRDFDYLEQTEFNQSIEKIRNEKKRVESAIRMTQARLDAQKVRMEILGEEDPEEETIPALLEQLEELKEESSQLAVNENAILQRMEAKKPYWAELAKGAASREKTLCQLRAISQPENLWEEINDECLTSMMISITTYKDHVAVRWVDDSVTELTKD